MALQRQDISKAVLAVIQGWHFDAVITEDTNFDFDLPIDGKVKALYYYAIRIHLENQGYTFCNFKPQDCEQAVKVGDIVEAVWDDLNPTSKQVM